MKKIRTVMGDFDPSDIGITLIHEHTYMLDFDIQLRELAEFKEQGGDCVVDQTTFGLGRRPILLKKLAEETGLHVVASTGFYREESHPEIVIGADIETIANVMISEIEEAVEGMDYKAGIIGEVGTTEFGTTEQEEKTLRASAKAQLATGVTVSVHTMGGAEALRAIDILQEEGVIPERILIDHIDLDHVEHLRLVAERGVFLGFDTIGKARYRDDTLRLEVLCAMVELGYEDLIDELDEFVTQLDELKDLKLEDIADKLRDDNVIVVETDRDLRVGGYESWWDVPIAEVSEMPAVRAQRAEYQRKRDTERHHL